MQPKSRAIWGIFPVDLSIIICYITPDEAVFSSFWDQEATLQTYSDPESWPTEHGSAYGSVLKDYEKPSYTVIVLLKYNSVSKRITLMCSYSSNIK